MNSIDTASLPATANFHACLIASGSGDKPLINMTIRQRILKQLCDLDISIIYVLGEAEEAAEIFANEKKATLVFIKDEAEFSTLVSDDRPCVRIRDDVVYPDVYLKQQFELVSADCELPVEGGYPVAAHGRSELERIIFSNLAKETDGIVSKTLNRPVSGLISRMLARAGFSPMTFTWVTGLLSLLMLWALLSDGTYAIVGGCLLFHLVSVLDGVDGEIARSTYTKTALGARLDTGLDMMANVMFMGGLQYALWNFYGAEFLVFGGYIISLVLSGILMMTSLLYFGPGGGSFDVLAQTIRKRLGNHPFWLATFNNLNYFFKRDCFAFIFAIVGLLGLERLIPASLIFGLIVWNVAILFNARYILAQKQEKVVPIPTDLNKLN
ncbi:CDP-alcohol phosphatidyltransferase family protein [Emcibacter sp.]|uniref:CDP-alcohol phosphatidyltransferase family protein n=1 Tax=Emcibacter sp. TaxID=1979954 RepID=UPI002AA685E5|nr:CDP-alcohol phosphatidyltransferase family protein [Emcibacter sp.]